ncbi:hypothetical protein EKO04_000631 [Ascochyta lentis]|uniref:BTB domain-containing protein n=1 Tax=Ascochyta lentis TaxID=205686 RepID=A0A8H7JEJ2_9PLEO|nr:hypothetical protein EKO04_000631 [Ascochyta lentis]
MESWEPLKNRKSNRNKKKQTASMSEPVDLEAGKPIDESAASGAPKSSVNPVGTPAVPHAIGASGPLDEDAMTEDASLAADKEPVKTTKAPFSPPLKIKSNTTDEKNTGDSVQDDDTVSKLTDSFVPGPSRAEVVKGSGKEELCMIPLVSAWSSDPELHKENNGDRTLASSDSEQQNTTVAVVEEASDKPLPIKANQNANSKEAILPSLSIPKKATSDVGCQTMSPTESETVSSFDHRTFSGVNNTLHRTTNDRGPQFKVQTDQGTFTVVHESVLRQSSNYFQNMCEPAYIQARKNSRELSWSPNSSFKGITSTYVHWLYNGNVPTAVIDMSDKTKVGAVLLGLAKEYVLGSQIIDTTYQNVIMDHFIAIHVRMRKLTFGSVIDVVYEGTHEGSPMRQLLADMHAFVIADDVGKLEMMYSKPRAFVEDVLKSVVTLSPNELDEWWRYLESKTYHI